MAATKKGRRRFAYGSIYQRKCEGNWTIDFRTLPGERIQKVIKGAITQQDAHEALKNAIRKEFLRSQGIKIERDPIQFDELAHVYLNDYAKANKRSWKDDEYRIEAHMKPFFGSLELEEITPLTIEKYRTQRLETGVRKSTVNREITIMKKMFNLAMDWRLASVNPVLKVKLFSEKDSLKQKILSENEEKKLFEESPDYLKPILSVALLAGLRRGEILNLKWNQIDLSRRIINVQHTKNGKDRRIPINDRLNHELLKLKNMNGGSDYVFPNPETGRPFVDIKGSFKAACARAGVTGLRFHDLRHTFASRLIQRGCDIETLRTLLGHHSISITERYIHTNDTQKREAIKLLSK